MVNEKGVFLWSFLVPKGKTDDFSCGSEPVNKKIEEIRTLWYTMMVWKTPEWEVFEKNQRSKVM